MSLFEHLFNTTLLEVVVPDTSVVFPSQNEGDEWLEQLKSGPLERKQAFFDELLEFILIARIEKPDPNGAPDPKHPPTDLLNFLSHLQVSLEATYISPLPTQAPTSPPGSRLATPPRSDSMKLKPRNGPAAHPSIFPPSTPSPIPSTADTDRKYMRSDGTLLAASIWGHSTVENSREAFALLWSEKDQRWVAVYKLAVSVAFLRLPVSDPVLCLTVSATLREKPIAMTQKNHPLVAFLTSVEDESGAVGDKPANSTTAQGQGTDDDEDDELDGLEEVNLLEGLGIGPTFPSTGPHGVSLPSTRLGPRSRRQIFSLQPASPSASSPATTPTTHTAYPTLRKSFRKTLHTVSGFRVRMRTVFVPYVVLGGAQKAFEELEDEDDERERRDAGNEERTVVLCVEVENAGESGPGVGFTVEGVDVHIGGEGAKAMLIGWGEGVFGKEAESKAFPLRVGSMEQYNLLYAVSFLHSPDDADSLSLNPSNPGGASVSTELQRAVTININGKPFIQKGSDDELLYPTHTFSSRWNCVLDLSAPQQQRPESVDFGNYTMREVLPEPPSPFPMPSPRTATLASVRQSSPAVSSPFEKPPALAVAGSKRHTMPANTVASRALRSSVPPANYRASTPVLNPLHPPATPGPGKLAYTPPSITVQSYARSPTTYGAPPTSGGDSSQSSYDPYANMMPPPTPAYPAYPQNSTVPPTPQWQAPTSSQQTGSVGPSVEIRRERGGPGGAQTPGPTVMGATFGERGLMDAMEEEGGEPIVVSVGLMPLARRKRHPGRIFPLDQFTLDIFVFNKSSWTRRFEVTFPERRGRRREMEKPGAGPGLLPLENRVRVGPLQPSTCQSVRMEFLALTPGVHSIDTLTLTDIQSGFSMNLRSVIDIVVHESNDG
ncbi:hypothetical protein PLICRDRAFT_36980 [Plicaturopsis crispa FD-325 SS-3]|nr:hypothetical protein PLICRDRAFT_36980 [Plicaturopsis crispa FD-325 SS-3]